MNDKQLKKTPTASGNPVGGSISGFSEISDNEEEFLNFSKKLQEKDEEIETLRKETRNIERSFKKTQIELENERDYWKRKTETLEQDYSSKPLIKLANDLQERLSEKEREILALKDSELALKRELFHLKENNLQLKNANSLLNSRGNRPKSVSIDLNSTNNEKKSLVLNIKPQPSTCKLTQIDEKAEFSPEMRHPTHEILFNTIRTLKEEKQALEENLNKIKEVAIDSVVEKEKELIEMKNKCEEIEINYRNQLELTSNELEVLRRKVKYAEGDSETSSPKHAASLKQFRSLENELENLKNLYREEKVNFLYERESLDARIKDLMKENEAQETDFKRKLDKLQKEMDDQIYAKVREDTQNSKDLQQELLKELQVAEEKYRELQKKYIAIQQEMRTLQNNHEREINEANSKSKEITNKLKNFEGQDQKRLDIEKKYEGEKKKLILEMEGKMEKIQGLESSKLELSKKLAFVEGENNQFRMKNLLLKENCDNLKMENEDLKGKNNDELRHFQSSVAELDLKYSQEKDFLERELKRMKEMYEPEGRGTVVFGTLRADLTEFSLENPPIIKRPDSSPTRHSYEPGPHMRVSILEPNSSQEDPVLPKDEFEKVVADSDLYIDLRSQIDEKEGRITSLEEEKQELLAQIERLKISYQQEIELLKEDQKLHLTDIQNMRKTFILKSEESAMELEMGREIESLKNENMRLLKELNENKQVYENEVLFLKEENERLEKRMLGFKENYNKIVNERDVYMQKLNHVMTYIRKKKAEKDQENKSGGGLFGLRLSLFRR